MKITSKVVKKKSPKEFVFPCLAQSTLTNIIVLMSSSQNYKGEGIVVVPGNEKTYHQVGYYSISWDLNCFEPFVGEITLTQSND